MKKNRPLGQLMHYMMPHKGSLLLAVLSSILNKLCDIVPEILIGIAIDVVVNQQHSTFARLTNIQDPYMQLYLVAGVTALLWIGESVFEYCYLILWKNLAHTIQHTLRLSTYGHMQQLDTAYFENKTTGGLLSIINDDINQMELFLSEGPNAIIQLIVNIVVMGGIFTYISPILAVLTLIPVPFVIIIAYYFQNRLARLYGAVRERVEALGSHIASRLIGITTIKSYTCEQYEIDCFAQESLAYKQESQRASHVNAAYIPIVRMGILSGFIMSMIAGGILALNGELPISFYAVLVFLTQRFLWPFTTLTIITDMYERAMASTRRVFTILEQQSKIVDGEQRLELGNVRGALAFKDVSFAYSNGVTIFKNLSLNIAANSTVAFVGSTGSGKSTIIKLILRFYDSMHGIISLDDTDIRILQTTSLRQAIALVSQEVYLVNGTIADNIAYGSINASRKEIMRAAQLAQADSFIMQLPQGYDSLVGENGKNLSGGQRQRISIARAILKNPPIFIFDEATSALDNETEAIVQRSMKTLAHNHTMIIIAHRLSTVRHADTIFVMEKGAIVESGNHDQLIALQGTYATLWKIQTGELS